MRGSVNVKIGFGLLSVLGAAAWIAGNVASCGTAPTAFVLRTAPTPFIVQGPGQLGNDPPTLTVLEPNANITVGQGDPFLIRWTDTDRDDNAEISFSLVSTTSNESVLLVAEIDENDAIGPDSFTILTTLIPPDTYNLLGIIDDGVNPPVQQYAMLVGAAVFQRVVLTIVGPGEGPQTVPPIITVTQPAFNLSVAQEDVLTVSVQPTALAPDEAIPFDPDSDVRLFILLDLDRDPNNDDPANPVRKCVGGARDGEECTVDDDCDSNTCLPSKIIVLRELTITAEESNTLTYDIRIDLAVIPPRPAGEPYFIRATVDDGTNPRVHQYAVGTISVVRLAAGIVDLFDIGRTKSGARFYGFNPGAILGSSISHVGDFDADGVDDFIMVARFGNPQSVGPVGEAYLIYGQGRPPQPDSAVLLPGDRFGGTISVNTVTVSDKVSGVIFQAPPVRTIPIGWNCPPGFMIAGSATRTDGITDVSFVRDLTGDGRPEILFGLPHVHGAFDSTDYDQADDDPPECGCYPDRRVNNFTEDDQDDPDEIQFYHGGMAVMVNSQNRDNNPLTDPRPPRLDTTAIALELAGQRAEFILDAGGLADAGAIWARADNRGLDAVQLGNDPDEAGRVSGARFIAGGFDYVDPFLLEQPPRDGLFGQNVASMGDLNSDGLDEIIISAPRNERYLADLLSTYGFGSTHWQSTTFVGSITVLPGRNYNQEDQRDIDGEAGTAQTPYLDHHEHPPFGTCSPPVGRHYDIPADSFGVFAEDRDDMLGGGTSAGDFNQDGLDDILCGAPLNDLSSSLTGTGAVYVIYGRTIFGGIHLAYADDLLLRPPMLRIRGVKVGDQIGWWETAGLDVNGDRIDDVFISSPRTDFGNVTRPICHGAFICDPNIPRPELSLSGFDTCEVEVGEEVFCDDPCKVFDYDNDSDIDDDDRCVFCCLSDDCEPAADCIFGRNPDACCENLVDNGFVGIIFGGVFIDGDRDLSQLATSQLPGTRFFGSEAGHRAGIDVSSAGDFNQDGFGDILIAVPGETREDEAGRERLGVVYLVFGGTHLTNTTWNLRDDVGSDDLPGIVFLSPYVRGRPNEAAPTTVAFIGDINSDGFGDIAVGNPKADFIDLSFPQGPDAPGSSDPGAGRRTNTGDVYVIYGNNFGTNRAMP